MGIDPVTHKPLSKQSSDNHAAQNQLSSSSSNNNNNNSDISTADSLNNQAQSCSLEASYGDPNSMVMGVNPILEDNTNNNSPPMEISSGGGGQSSINLIDNISIDDMLMSYLWDDSDVSPWNSQPSSSYVGHQGSESNANANLSMSWEDGSSWLLDCQDFGIQDFGIDCFNDIEVMNTLGVLDKGSNQESARGFY